VNHGPFDRKDPERIAAPYNTLSGLWEVRKDGTAQWDNGFRMMDDLARHYPVTARKPWKGRYGPLAGAAARAIGTSPR
jgi:hypothetical protein